MAQSAGFKAQAEDACTAAEEFCSIFLDNFDKKRHQMMSKLYNETADIIWNGNHVKGVDGISQFISDLPESFHTCSSLDCQPVNDVATGGQRAVLVVMEGDVKFGADIARYFTQNFILTANEQNHWKIASHCFRFVDD